MSTARRLSLFFLVSCCLSVVMVTPPTLAQGEVQFRGTRDLPLHPIFGAITDDPGPFRRLDWGGTVTNQFSLPREEEPDEGLGGDTPPAVQFNPVSGYPIAIWSAVRPTVRPTVDTRDPVAQVTDVLVTHFTVGGWQAPVVLAEGSVDPVMAIDPQSGRVHLVYWTPDSGAVWYRAAPADLSSWTEPIRISDRREVAASPVLQLVGGEPTVAYESHLLGLRSTTRELVLAEFGEDGAIRRTVLAPTSHPGRTWLRLDSDGTQLLVRWLHSDHHAGWIRRDASGAWGEVVLKPTSVTPAREGAPSGAPGGRR